jgi:hypothetical protein
VGQVSDPTFGNTAADTIGYLVVSALRRVVVSCTAAISKLLALRWLHMLAGFYKLCCSNSQDAVGC